MGLLIKLFTSNARTLQNWGDCWLPACKTTQSGFGKSFFFLFFLFYLLRNFFFSILPPIKRLCNSDLTLSFLTSILLFKRNSNFTHHLNSLSRFCQSEGLESQWLALNWLSNIDDGERMCLGDHYFALFFAMPWVNNLGGWDPWWKFKGSASIFCSL